MIRVGLVQYLDDRLFRLVVHFRDEIVGGFFLDGDDVEIAGRAVDDVAGAARGLHRDIEHRMHGIGDPFRCR